MVVLGAAGCASVPVVLVRELPVANAQYSSLHSRNRHFTHHFTRHFNL
jgi:hypothetical protein